MKWVLENHEGTKVYYSADVIEKIKDLCEKRPFQTVEKILQVIENEDK